MTPKRRGPILRALTDNIGLKLAALAASIGVFLIVRGTDEQQFSVAARVNTILPDPNSDRMLVSEIPSEVRVTLRGSRSVLSTVRRNGLSSIEMDVRQSIDEPFHILDPEDFEIPVGASIVQIAPAAVPLTWVDRAERVVRVEPVLEGEVEAGHTVVVDTVDPETVQIRGAAPEVRRLRSWQTQPVDIQGMSPGEYQRRVFLAPLPDHVSTPGGAPVAVMVGVTIEEEEGSRLLSDIPIAVVGDVEASLRPSEVDIRLTGPRARVEQFNPRRVVPFVDLGSVELSRGGTVVPVSLRGVPAGMVAEPDSREVVARLR